MGFIQASDITVAILAGGQGRRMDGKDKGLLEFKGKPMVEHILDAIRPQASKVLINANRNRATYLAYGHPVIKDAMDDWQGPLAGFAVMMAQAQTPYILTLPCDGPFIPKNYVARMLAKINTPSQCAVAHDGKRLQPVHACLPVSLLENLESFLQGGGRKIDHWYADLDVALVDFSGMPKIFDNFNTKEQLQDGQAK